MSFVEFSFNGYMTLPLVQTSSALATETLLKC